MFGWSPGTDQVVALLPKVAECARFARGGEVSVVYRQAGRPALGISTGEELCPVSGLVGLLPGDFAGDPDAASRLRPRARSVE
jgi:hypothetical protein